MVENMKFDEDKTRRLTLNLPDETYKRLQFLSKQSHRSMTKYVNMMIDSQFEHLFGKNTKAEAVVHGGQKFGVSDDT